MQPSVFAHAGLGILGWNDFANTIHGVLGPEGDIGLGLDFRILPGFTLGAQVAFNAAAVPAPDDPTFETTAKWFNFGLTAGIHFGEPRPRHVRARRLVRGE